MKMQRADCQSPINAHAGPKHLTKASSSNQYCLYSIVTASVGGCQRFRVFPSSQTQLGTRITEISAGPVNMRLVR